MISILQECAFHFACGGGSAEFGVSPYLSDTAFVEHVTVHPLRLARAGC